LTKEAAAAAAGSDAPPLQIEEAARLYKSVSLILYASISLHQLEDLEKYLTSAAAKNANPYFVLSDWIDVLDSARNYRLLEVRRATNKLLLQEKAIQQQHQQEGRTNSYVETFRRKVTAVEANELLTKVQEGEEKQNVLLSDIARLHEQLLHLQEANRGEKEKEWAILEQALAEAKAESTLLETKCKVIQEQLIASRTACPLLLNSVVVAVENAVQVQSTTMLARHRHQVEELAEALLTANDESGRIISHFKARIAEKEEQLMLQEVHHKAAVEEWERRLRVANEERSSAASQCERELSFLKTDLDEKMRLVERQMIERDACLQEKLTESLRIQLELQNALEHQKQRSPSSLPRFAAEIISEGAIVNITKSLVRSASPLLLLESTPTELTSSAVEDVTKDFTAKLEEQALLLSKLQGEHEVTCEELRLAKLDVVNNVQALAQARAQAEKFEVLRDTLTASQLQLDASWKAQREVLETRVAELENRCSELSSQHEERVKRLEEDLEDRTSTINDLNNKVASLNTAAQENMTSFDLSLPLKEDARLDSEQHIEELKRKIEAVMFSLEAENRIATDARADLDLAQERIRALEASLQSQCDRNQRQECELKALKQELVNVVAQMKKEEEKTMEALNEKIKEESKNIESRKRAATTLQRMVRGFTGRRRHARIKNEKIAADAGVLLAFENTVQGESGWYKAKNKMFYFHSHDNTDWRLLLGPLEASQFDALANNAKRAVRSGFSGMFTAIGYTDQGLDVVLSNDDLRLYHIALWE